ncbi:MAG: hypothetical protein K5764_02660 [Prevotella sp.]|nr:hypothetical protein [Prevotella sp.]
MKKVTAKRNIYDNQNTIGAGDNGTCGTITFNSKKYWDGTNYKNGGETYLKQNPLIFEP